MGRGVVEISMLSGNLILSSVSSPWPGISENHLKGFMNFDFWVLLADLVNQNLQQGDQEAAIFF